jgi:hypothetical protein
MLRKFSALLVLSLGTLTATAAEARPLKLDEVYQLGLYLECSAACPTTSDNSTYEDYLKRETCLVACGNAPRIWEKNGIAPVDKVDLDLALLELQHAADPTANLICYADVEETVVVPAALCAGSVCEAAPECTDVDCAAPTEVELVCVDDMPGGPRCVWPLERRSSLCPDVVCDARPQHSFQECADGDADGLPFWLESHLGLDDGFAEDRCGTSVACPFEEKCVYQPDISAGLCEPRDCGDCTAFHLELVAEDDTEALIHVHYDYTPVPARALDLYLVYDNEAMKLADARPLGPLALQSKELATHHLSDGTLRVSIFDTGGTHPIPTGPIVELVFRRTGNGPTTVAFSTDDGLQMASVAPLQGNEEGQRMLTNDARWGAPIGLAAPDEATTKLRLWYGFDAPDSPLTYSNVPDGEALCERYPLCANESDEVERAKFVARLNALQAGRLDADTAIAGVTNGAVYFDGTSDHLRMPVTYEEPLAPDAQSFSFSTWFYSEGNSLNELMTSPQVIYSHNGFNERTRFGLRLVDNGAGAFNLQFFDGDLTSRNPAALAVTVAEALTYRTWYHVGFTYDATLGKVDLYFDGRRIRDYTFPRRPSFVCPQFFAGTDVLQHVEGDVLGGKPPEYVFYGANRSNLDAIEVMDTGGLGARTILGDSQYAYRDPDYNPTLDRLVYSSNASGSFEIWIANGDGSDARQVTVGFGDAFRGIAARRPRWAPDGSAIVFDSNVFDILAQDNAFRRVSHIYYIAYDAVANAVAIELPDGSTTEQLDYESLLGTGTIHTYRLTRAVQDRNHRNARWLRGGQADGARGELLIDTSNPNLDGQQIHILRVPQILELSRSELLPGLGESWHEIEMLAAHRSERAGLVPVTTELLFYQRDFATYDETTDYTLTETVDADGVTVSVAYAPAAFDSQCWDRNHNNVRETNEDRNTDGNWDTADCLPHEIRNLFVEYDATKYMPVLEDENGEPLTPGAVVVSQNKKLRLKAVEPFGHSYVRVEVMSPLDASPLVPGEIARLRFLEVGVNPATIEFGTFSRQAQTEYLVKDLTSVAEGRPFATADMFEQIDDAVFAPDGARLLISAFSKSRPVLLRTFDLLGASNAESLFVQPTKTTGIDWARGQGFYACNWAGGTLHLQNKQILGGLRGGLDDLRMYAGLRDPDAFRSEAERGREFLVRDGNDGELDSLLPTCGNNHAECPPFHLCIDQQCVIAPCDPNDPYSCSAHEARCTLRPMSVETEHSGAGGNAGAFDWVCAADCNVDSQCFRQQCLNGPCRFCEQSEHACVECRETTRQLGALTIATIEGCPDAKSFACVEGACVTECYAFEDGASRYLCDPLLEYCDRGRCVMHDWTWWDLAPATFSGVGETYYEVAPDPLNGWPGYSQAVDQRVDVVVNAYGVADFGQPPELVVEARGGPFFGADWNRIARILVRNETYAEAMNNPYVVSSPHSFNDLRVRLITAPYNNLTGAASGLGENDDQFCLADFAATAIAADEPGASPDACYYDAQGSQFELGYRADVTPYESIAHCRAHRHPGCPTISNSEHDFLRGGSPATVILDVQVDGGSVMNNLTSNLVCSYEGDVVPFDSGDRLRKLFYGDIQRERSNEKSVFCDANPDLCADATGLIEFDIATYGHALLNCNLVDPIARSAAGATFENVIIVRDFPLESGAILETANNCTVDIDAFRVEPCYTWVGGGGSVDPNNDAVDIGESFAFATFDFGNFTSFGHDEGFDDVPLSDFPLTISVSGYEGGGLEVGFRNSVGTLVETLSIPNPPSPGATVSVTSTNRLPPGRRFFGVITRQPSLPNHSCRIAETTEAPVMLDGGATLSVLCERTRQVSVTTTGLRGTLVLTNAFVAPGESTTSGIDDLTVTANGTTEFGTSLRVGTGYAVSIKRQPAEQICSLSRATGTISNAPPEVSVSCRDVITSELRVTVSGLLGRGLELVERVSGRTVRPNANGVIAFPGRFAERASYTIGVAAQPDDPSQRCTFADSAATASGTMGTSDVLAGTLTCVSLPTYSIGGTVAGLRGSGLRIALNDTTTVTIDKPVIPGDAVRYVFPKRLLGGAPFTVTVLQQPEAPAQNCSVLVALGEVGTADVTTVDVACGPRPPVVSAYRLGGSVSGLEGSGLKIAFDTNVQNLELTQNGSFAFSQLVESYTDYNIQIVRQPSNPTQICAIDNASGQMGTADVTDLRVVCRSAMKVTVDVQSTQTNGAQLRAMLFTTSDPPELIAVSPEAPRIQNGRAIFVMRDPKSQNLVTEAVLESGDYVLYLLVNDDLDFDAATGAPVFSAGADRGAVIYVTGTPTTPPRVTVTDADLSPLVSPELWVLGDLTDFEGEVTCAFTPVGVTAEAAFETGTTLLPVIGTTTRTCALPNQACDWESGFEMPGAVALPVGLPYDVHCSARMTGRLPDFATRDEVTIDTPIYLSF